MSPALDLSSPCPCGTGRLAESCCAPVHSGAVQAPTAEALMRSRYSAFVVGDVDHLLASWHPQTRPEGVQPDPGLRWTKLEIVETSGGGLFDAEGIVEFRAHYSDGGRRGDMHERSRFVRHDGAWVYWGPILAGR